MQSLEQDIGGVLLERGAGGVELTAAGHALLKSMRPVLADFDIALAKVRRQARGQSQELRVGYLMSAAMAYLNPALAALRKAHPEVKVQMRDLSPGEQIAALRAGELDVALLGQAGELVKTEFYVKTLAVLPLVVAMPADHPLATRKAVKLSDLKAEVFVGAFDEDVPGANRWLEKLCRSAGFRAKIVQNADSLSHALSVVVTEGALTILPGFSTSIQAPGVVFKPLQDKASKTELMVAWQRGKASPALKTLIEALPVAKRS